MMAILEWESAATMGRGPRGRCSWHTLHARISANNFSMIKSRGLSLALSGHHHYQFPLGRGRLKVFQKLPQASPKGFPIVFAQLPGNGGLSVFPEMFPQLPQGLDQPMGG